MTSLALTRLLQLCSPALPVGAYAYSQGLESANDAGHVTDVDAASKWISGVFNHGLLLLDVPALALSYAAWQHNDLDRIASLNEYLQASRETAELQLEDIQMGRSLNKLLVALDLSPPVLEVPSFVTQFAFAGVAWGISLEDLMIGFCFSWLENQVSVATKIVPLGQSAAQRLLAELSVEIEQAVSTLQPLALDADSKKWNFGQSLPGLAILSSRHETQESRLYRS